MTLTPNDLISYPSRVSPKQAIAGLERILGAHNVTDDDRAFAVDLDKACDEGGIDFAFAYAHGANESDWYTDPDFTQGNNAFGIGHDDNATTGTAFPTKRACARFYVVELLLKMRRPIPASLSDARSYAPKRYDEIVRIVGGSMGPFPKVERIKDLNTRFGPNNREAAWMTDATGPQSICAKGNALLPNLPPQDHTPSTTTTPPPGGEPPVSTKPYVLLVAGHRSYNDGGNPAEKDLTDDLARLYTQEFRAAGYRADWWQRDIDRDADPDDTVGGLDTVSLGCAAHLATISGPKVLLDLHFNGSTSPVHAIVPDSRGLTTAYTGGAPADDAYTNNTLDRAFAAKWAGDVAREFGLSLFHGRANEPGVMLEGETGVGLQGYRLATMAASARHRRDTVRSVLEHAGTSQWGSGAAREAKFKRCAQIAVAAVNAVYNVTSEPPKPTDPKPPKPPKPPAEPEYAERITTGFTGKDGTVTRKVTIKTGEKDKNGKAITERVDVVYDLWLINRPFEVIVKTKRRQGPDPRQPIVGPPLVKDETFTATYQAVPRKQVGKDIPGTNFIVTEIGTWIQANHLHPRLSIRKA